MKKILIISILLLNIFIVSSCWSYIEVEERLRVSGFALDYDENNKEYILTIEVLNPQKREKGYEGRIFTTKGRTMIEAIRNIITESGSQFYWAHAKVFIIDEAIAKKGLVPVLDLIYRDAEIRDTIWVCIARENSAGKILSEVQDKRHKLNAFHIRDLMEAKGNSNSMGIRLWKLVKTITAKNISPTLPIVKISNPHKGKLIIIDVSGSAVFKGDKLVGWLDSEETKYYLWIINQLKGGRIILNPNIDNKPLTVVLEITSSKTQLEPILSNGKISMKITVKKANFNIGEIDGSTNPITKEGLESIKQKAEEYLNKSIINVTEKVQKNYKSDIFGFSTAIKNKYPEYWREIEDEWDSIFPNIPLEVKVNVNIIGSSLNNNTIEINE